METSTALARAIVDDDPLEVSRLVCGTDPPAHFVAPGVPAIAYAAYLMRESALDALLAARVDVNAKYEHEPFRGWNAFNIAAATGNVAVAGKLVAAGCDAKPPANEATGRVWLNLMETMGDNLTDFISAWRLAADPAAFLRWTDPAGRGAMHVASILGSALFVDLLFDLGCTDASPVDCARNTPLCLAVAHTLPSMTCIESLLTHGAIPTESHVKSALARGLTRLVAVLVTAGAPPPPGVSRRTVKAAVAATGRTSRVAAPRSVLVSDVLFSDSLLRGNFIAFETIFKARGADANAALPHAAAYGDARAVEYLLKQPGVNVDTRIESEAFHMTGATPLHLALSSYEPRDAVVALLVDAGADVNATLPCGLQPLDVAYHASSRELLIARGARHAAFDAGAIRERFRTTLRLMGSLMTADSTEMRLAIQAGASANCRDLLGGAPLTACVMDRRSADVIWLLNSGAKLRVRNYAGDNLLHLAVRTGDVAVVELLLAAGVDPAQENAFGCCSARLAARLGVHGAWRAITRHIAALRVPEDDEMRRRGTQPSSVAARRGARQGRKVAQQVSSQQEASPEDFQRKKDDADRMAAELIAEEDIRKRTAVKKEAKAESRRLKRLRLRARRIEEAIEEAERKAAQSSEVQDAGGEESSSGDESVVSEPGWLANLLDDFHDARIANASGRRTFVEQAIRTAASLKLQLENVGRCSVCLTAARGSVLQPCGHTSLCRGCAVHVAENAGEMARKCPVCMQRVSGWGHAFI